MGPLELFVKLGFNADTMKLKDFGKALAELNMSSVMAAIGVGTLYEATSKIMSVGDAAGMSMYQFSMITGLSAQEMQKFGAAAEEVGVSSKTAQSSVEGLQMEMIDLMKSHGKGEVFAVAGISAKDVMGDPFKLMRKLRDFMSDPNIGDKQKLFVASNLPAMREMMPMLKQSADWWDHIQDKASLSEKDISRIRDYHKAIAQLSYEWGIILERVAGRLAPMLSSLAHLTDNILKLTSHESRGEGAKGLAKEYYSHWVPMAPLYSLGAAGVQRMVHDIDITVSGTVTGAEDVAHHVGVELKKVWNEVFHEQQKTSR